MAQKQRYDPNICPECGGRLRLIQGPFGKFMGCENYPTCKFRRVRKNRNVRVRTVLIVLYLWKLLQDCNMQYLNQLEWLIRTDTIYSGIMSRGK